MNATEAAAQLNSLRREVAELLRSNKQEHARIRVEAVLREANLLKAYDILELFTEMLAVRVQIIEKSKDTPLDMLESLSSIVYASQRIQVRRCARYSMCPVVHTHSFSQWHCLVVSP